MAAIENLENLFFDLLSLVRSFHVNTIRFSIGKIVVRSLGHFWLTPPKVCLVYRRRGEMGECGGRLVS